MNSWKLLGKAVCALYSPHRKCSHIQNMLPKSKWKKKQKKPPKVNLKFSKIMHDRACGETKSLFMCRLFNSATLNRVKLGGFLIRYSFLFCLNMQTETLQRKNSWARSYLCLKQTTHHKPKYSIRYNTLGGVYCNI